MTYQLFDKDGKQVTPGDLQNRGVWYKHGVRREDFFVEQYAQKFDVQINPEKKVDPTLPDLIHNEHLADLKCQNTPFFFSSKVGIDPRYAVTFNLKDAFNYGAWGKNYESLVIFFWVDWVAAKMVSNGKSYMVDSLTGVWRANYSVIEQMRRTSPIHWYNQRTRQHEANPQMQKSLSEFEPRLVDGKNVWSIREIGVNAACSYVLDLRTLERLE